MAVALKPPSLSDVRDPVEPFEREHADVEYAALQSLVRRIPLLLGYALPTVAVTSLVLWEYARQRAILIWLLLSWAVLAAALLAAMPMRWSLEDADLVALRRRVLVRCLLPSVLPWMTVGFVAMPSTDHGVLITTAMVAAGMAAISITIGALSGLARFSAVLLIGVPNLVWLVLHHHHTSTPFVIILYAAAFGSFLAAKARIRLLDREALKLRTHQLVETVQADRANLSSLNARLQYRATHDQLMGIPNRELFERELQQAVVTSHLAQASVGLLFLDLDRFKFVNDTLGHAAGDSLLKAVGERIRGVLRGNEAMVARVGGDELVVLMREVREPHEMHQVAERLRAAVNDRFVIDGVDLSLGVSIGMSMSRPGDSAEDVYRLADAALYEAKEHGRNCAVMADDTLRTSRSARISTELALRSALVTEHIEAWYQPEVDLVTGQIVAAEALARWRTDDDVVIASDFIGVARRAGLLEQLMLCMADQVWSWQPAEGRIPIGLNVSAAHLDSLLAHHEAGRRERPFENMRLEIAETDIIRDFDGARELLARVRQLGAQVLLDDFGSGYSSLRMLTLPIDGIKIDRSYVAEAIVDRRVRDLVTSLAEFGRNAGMLVIAEGVETAQQAEFLVDIGVERGQGFLFAGALPPAEFDALRSNGLMPLELASRF